MHEAKSFAPSLSWIIGQILLSWSDVGVLLTTVISDSKTRSCVHSVFNWTTPKTNLVFIVAMPLGVYGGYYDVVKALFQK